MNQPANSPNRYLGSVIIIGILFFIFGFVTWLNGALMPFLQTACEITPFQASLVTLAFYIAYFVMALPSSFVLKEIGYKNGLFVGLVIMAIGAFLFIPAAYTRIFGVFLLGLFILGTGLALLQTAVNPFITIIGPTESAAVRISIMGICNKFAGFISPLVLSALIMHGMDKFEDDKLKILAPADKDLLLNELAARLVQPYMIMGFVLLAFGVFVKYSSLPDKLEIEDDDDHSIKSFVAQIPAALKIPHVLLGVITLFLYVGVEVMAGDSLTQFGKELDLPYASTLTSYTMAFMIVGYIAGILFIPKYISQSKALQLSAILGFVSALGTSFASVTDVSIFSNLFGWINTAFGLNIPLIPNSVFFVTLLGLANALMWPAIWPLALEGVGKYTKIVSALLIMSIAGGALIPPVYASLGQAFDFQSALIIMVPCYLFILFYALKGHRIQTIK